MSRETADNMAFGCGKFTSRSKFKPMWEDTRKPTWKAILWSTLVHNRAIPVGSSADCTFTPVSLMEPSNTRYVA